jgi:hypothetical protein
MKILAENLCSRIGVTQFSDTILDKVLNHVTDGGAVSSRGPWIAGGAVRRTITGEKLDSDFDFFFANEQQATDFETLLINRGALLQHKNEKNSTYILPAEPVPDLLHQDGSDVILPEIKIQVIKFRYYNSAEEVIDSFDFTLTQFAYDGKFIYMGDFSLWDVARKRLVPHRITYAVSSLRRLLKYAKQGYTVCAGGLSEILQQTVNDPSIINAETLYID